MSETSQNALKKYKALGYPTTKNEDWKYTNLFQLKEKEFKTPLAKTKVEILSQKNLQKIIEKYEFAKNRLVFCDGFLIDELSAFENPDFEMKALNSPENELAVSKPEKMFRLMNTAHAKTGYFIKVKKDADIKDPLVMLFLSSQDSCSAHYKNRIEIGVAAKVQILEVYYGDAKDYFNNITTQIISADGSSVFHSKIQQESISAFHIHELIVEQKSGSHVESSVFSLGGRLVRNEIDVSLSQPGANIILNGLFVGAGNQHVDNRTVIDHAAPDCQSLELYKGILDENAVGVFNGKIVVQRDSQRTDARQTNKNLLLSESAQINTLPQLLIYADDVKCAHGATIGQLDKAALFYLQSRGIEKEEGVNILTRAFASEMIDRIENVSIKEILEATLQDWFSRESDLH